MRGGGSGLLPASFSGHERDHTFLSRQGTQFADISGISGLDHDGDGRAFALFDYERDGWLDMVMVSASAPFVQLFRNQIGDGAANLQSHGLVAFRFVGGNRAAQPAAGWSARDGYGVMATVRTSGKTLRREHRAGEGFAAQNSSTMVVGLGEGGSSASATFRWPSGKTQTIESVSAGSLVTVYENPEQSPTGEAFVTEPYYRTRDRKPLPHRLSSDRFPGKRLEIATAAPPSGLRVFTTMATWCPSCKFWHAQTKDLAASFRSEDVHFFGVPVDRAEDRTKLQQYVDKIHPPYKVLLDATGAEVEMVKKMVVERFGQEQLPTTFVTDAAGRVLLTIEGVPSVSDIARLLRETRLPTGSQPVTAHSAKPAR